MFAEFSDFIGTVERFGVPVIILAAFSYFVAGSIKWLGNNVIMTLQNRHMAFLDKIEERMSSIDSFHESIKATQEEIMESQEDIIDHISDIEEFLGVVHLEQEEEIKDKPVKRRKKAD